MTPATSPFSDDELRERIAVAIRSPSDEATFKEKFNATVPDLKQPGLVVLTNPTMSRRVDLYSYVLAALEAAQSRGVKLSSDLVELLSLAQRGFVLAADSSLGGHGTAYSFKAGWLNLNLEECRLGIFFVSERQSGAEQRLKAVQAFWPPASTTPMMRARIALAPDALSVYDRAMVNAALSEMTPTEAATIMQEYGGKVGRTLGD